MAELMAVEVAYALAEKQKIVLVQVPENTTVRQVVESSGLDVDFPDIDLANAKVGIFGKVVADPESEVVKVGDRIEIYRPLLIDPKQARLNRAAKKDS